MKIATILDQIDLGAIALPEFQRGYVWNRDQVRGLMGSLYKKHPIGSLLVWVTNIASAKTRGDGAPAPGTIKLLLDGQQRITSLYGIIRGRPPQFVDGNGQTVTGLHFSLEDETFEFYAPVKMKDNPLWIDVTQLMRRGVGDFILQLTQVPELQPSLQTYISRLNAIDQIKEVDLHIEEVTGEDKTIDVVVTSVLQTTAGKMIFGRHIDANAPQRGEIMVFHYPEDPSVDYIKRIVGTPGDLVEYRDKRLTINGQPLAYRENGTFSFETGGLNYVTGIVYREKLGTHEHAAMTVPGIPGFVPEQAKRFPYQENCTYNEDGFACRVPAGHYFMMGDNRDGSNDSRYWGFVPERNIVGKAFLIWMNFGDFKRIGTMID